MKKPMVEKPLTKGQLRAAKKQAKNDAGTKPAEHQKPTVATKTGPAKKQATESSEFSESESSEEEKPAKKKPAMTTSATKTVPESKSISKKPSSESSESESESSSEEASLVRPKIAKVKSGSSESSESSESSDKEDVPVKVVAKPTEPKSNKVTISTRKTKHSGLITSVVNIPDDINLEKLARALGKVYKCKTRVRTRGGVPTIELKGQHTREAREFLTKVKIVELRQINMV